MKVSKFSFNILAPIQIVATIILGTTGLVSWWTIVLIWLVASSIDFTWKK